MTKDFAARFDKSSKECSYQSADHSNGEEFDQTPLERYVQEQFRQVSECELCWSGL